MRALRRAPAMSLLAALSVALGIGANTAIFSLVNALLLRPISGVRAPEKLVGIDAALPSTVLDELGKDPVFAGACGVSTTLLTTELRGLRRCLAPGTRRRYGLRPATKLVVSRRGFSGYLTASYGP